MSSKGSPDISQVLAMSWGGDRNLALRAALSLPPLPEDQPEPKHKCWVDINGVAWYQGPDATRIASAFMTAGLDVNTGGEDGKVVQALTKTTNG